MKRIIQSLSVATLLLASLPVQAEDWVLHSNDKPQQLSSSRKIQVVNLWATWCKPCRAEMPVMSRWYQNTGKRKNIEMVGIALDSKENVSAFLKTTPVSYPIWRYTGANSRAMMRDFGNKVGGLPFTVVRKNGCATQKILYGEVDGAKLDQAVDAVQKQCGV